MGEWPICFCWLARSSKTRLETKPQIERRRPQNEKQKQTAKNLASRKSDLKKQFSPQTQMSAKKNSPNSNRRCFLAAAAASLAGVLPPLTGLGVLLNPLRKKSNLGQAVRVTSLSALPADGVPRKFSVVTDRVDAWNHFRNVPIGAVYLRRTEENSVEAFSVNCPHAGCFVEYRAAEKNYLCPCHDSRFNIDGSIQDPNSPSPRGLDSLEVDEEKLQSLNEVWVRFQKFQAGQAEKRDI